MAFAWAISSNVFLPWLNAMCISITLHTTQKKANHLAFLDCRVTKCFFSQRFINQYKLEVQLLETPQRLQNADGSLNGKDGGLTHYTELKVLISNNVHLLHFYITDMGNNDLVLGYLWFTVTNACLDWKTGMLPASVIICIKGVASGKPACTVWVAGIRTMIRNQPFLQQGDELFLHIIKVDPTHAAKATVAQQLAEQATDKTTRTWDQIVSPQYHTHTKVFSEDATQQFPESCEWDHAIDLKPDAPNSLDCKVYLLSLNEDTTVMAPRGRVADKPLSSVLSDLGNHRKFCRF